MPGKHITHRQEKLYMQHRQEGAGQDVAAAKAGISVRSGRRIETSTTTPRAAHERDWRTREDPLAAVWETELLPLLETEPGLTGTTLLDYLQEVYPEHYDQRILRTLQRRVKQWRALHGPEREVIFRQQAVVAQHVVLGVELLHALRAHKAGDGAGVGVAHAARVSDDD